MLQCGVRVGCNALVANVQVNTRRYENKTHTTLRVLHCGRKNRSVLSQVGARPLIQYSAGISRSTAHIVGFIQRRYKYRAALVDVQDEI